MINNAAWADTSSSLTGDQFKEIFLHKLCTRKWPAACIARLLDVLRDVVMTPEQLQLVVGRVRELMKGVEVEELPPLVYQLLLFSTKVCVCEKKKCCCFRPRFAVIIVFVKKKDQGLLQ